MRELGLKSRIAKAFTPTTTQADPSKRPAPNTLDRDFRATAPNRKWVTDITYLLTAEGLGLPGRRARPVQSQSGRLVAMSRQIIFVVIAVLTPAAGQAAQYFVSPTGSDSAAGTSGAPWQTLQHAADVVAPGDHVTALAGDYVGFYLSTSGTAAAPIEFDAGPGVLISQPNATTPDGINLESASHIIIDGFSVSGMPRAGVRAVGLPTALASFVTIRNVTAANNGVWGIFTGHVNDLLIESNQASGSVEQHGIYVSNSGDRPVIRDNIIFDNHGSGIHMNGDASQGGDGIISGAIVTGNRIYNNALPNSVYPMLGGGSGINMDGVQNSRIENNLVYNNHASGISLYRIDGAAGSIGNVIVNNTVYEPSDGRWALNIQHGSTGNTALNNILISDHSFRGAIDISTDSLARFTSDYNAMISRFTTNGGNSVMSLSQWQISTGEDTHSLIANAADLFADSAGGDYHLLSTAPARNAGTSQLRRPAISMGYLAPLAMLSTSELLNLARSPAITIATAL